MVSILLALLSVGMTIAQAAVTSPSNASLLSAKRNLLPDFPDDIEPMCDIAERVSNDVLSAVGAFAEEHENMIEHLEQFHEGLEFITEAAEIADVEVPITKAFHIASGWALSFIHMAQPEQPEDVNPIYPLGDAPCEQCACSKDRMEHSFELADLDNELFYFKRVDVDLSTQAVPVLEHCGPLPGAVWTQTVNIADNIDELPLEQMCSTQLSENNLNLCLGSGNILMSYVDTASRGHANAMSILDDLRDEGITENTPKYPSSGRDDDNALLQLVEGPFFWRFGQPRLASFLAYAHLIAACYDRRPQGTDWGAENGAIGWSSLDDAKRALQDLVQAVRIDLDDVHEGLKEASVRASLREYKKNYIQVTQTIVCKTTKKKNPKVYVEIRDVSPELHSTGIDLSRTHGDYTGIPHDVARTCFETTDKCNKRAKNHPFYTSWSDSNREWHGSDSSVFAVGCYSAAKTGKEGDNAVYLPSQDLMDYWEPHHSIVSERASIARLDDYREYSGNAGIGYGVDQYLDTFIRPRFEAKYDSFFTKIRALLDKVETNAIQPMQEVLDENEEAYIKYLFAHSGSGVRVKNKDQELLGRTRLSNDATDDLKRRLSSGRRLSSANGTFV